MKQTKIYIGALHRMDLVCIPANKNTINGHDALFWKSLENHQNKRRCLERQFNKYMVPTDCMMEEHND